MSNRISDLGILDHLDTGGYKADLTCRQLTHCQGVRSKDADLQVLDGEPLVSTTRVQYVIADGTIVVSPEN